MNVSLNWLSSYIDLEGLGTQEMADMLTFAGIEVEGIQQRGVTTDLVGGLQVPAHRFVQLAGAQGKFGRHGGADRVTDLAGLGFLGHGRGRHQQRRRQQPGQQGTANRPPGHGRKAAFYRRNGHCGRAGRKMEGIGSKLIASH